MSNQPVCTKVDCRGQYDKKPGRCAVLISNHFRGRKQCPFYKTEAQFQEEERLIAERLERLGKLGILAKYE